MLYNKVFRFFTFIIIKDYFLLLTNTLPILNNAENLLLSIILSPLILSIIILFINKDYKKVILKISIVGTLLNILLLFFLITFFNTLDISSLYCFHTIEFFNFHLNFGVDNISIILLILTGFLTLICLLISINIHNFKNFTLYFLLMQFLLYLAWTVLDVFIFYICFESVLIPMFLVINTWGSRNRKFRASYMFFIYTLAGSIAMLIAIFFIFMTKGTTDLLVLLDYGFSIENQRFLWIAFFLAMAVKIPVVPFHSWLPEAHVEAPTGGSVLLAGVLLKLGGYGILRFLLPLFPEASVYFSTLITPLCLCSIIYASFTALRQNDLKRVIAYASIAHMNLIVLGLFSFNLYGIQGSIFQMISHGLVSGLLFICIGILYDRAKTRLIYNYSGLVITMPKFIVIFFLATIANMAHPGTSSFVGEFLLFFGIFKFDIFLGILSTLGIFLCGTYSIWLFNRVAFGNIQYRDINHKDLSFYELTYLTPLTFLIFLFGIKPNLILDLSYINVINLLKYIV